MSLIFIYYSIDRSDVGKCRHDYFVSWADQRGNISQVAKELGVSDSQLSKWRKELQQYQHNSFPGRGVERLTDEQREIKELRKQLKDKELDLEILKNAIAFFSRADQ